ncbi:MAG: scpB [Anaerosolibacter sp.]|jgi:segregation and condensation protein B|uniref:SMC-Scp complex subunit ScpB n=1 Tax=Anaerosolibacter sp. TaxID=1872527 RepID=UPI00261B957D|nr:SMC-Scp complex subunit ScpB [Anaerosolibacter sp.]MDF2546433.1 scpB [Anaerosolibacter sp.]
MEDKEIQSIIESLLFIWGDPLNVKNISEVLDFPPEFIRKTILDLKKQYEAEDRGLQIIEINNSFQLCTNTKHYDYIQKLCTPTQNKGLTQAALEVLAIIAYKQPITRHEVEGIRGVKSDKAISTLLDKELILEKGRLEKTGRPILYGTTETFLKAFGLSCLEDLPAIEDFEKLDFDENEINKTDE